MDKLIRSKTAKVSIPTNHTHKKGCFSHEQKILTHNQGQNQTKKPGSPENTDKQKPEKPCLAN
ncbi:hypothetical protein [Motiliproteus sp. MSK22-1]|uniref:hypothetical protein n=1 Tax=Motiliproteus sp. MSK22-1 TaxID=1897630 RepID=UPI00097549B2|nr:hypothetical protein [Motiliproteus sp. MSK22-1]OMH30549.1 hypothetical protein BGP75_17600 [Motiliproteus sp. MSK22-1]